MDTKAHHDSENHGRDAHAHDAKKVQQSHSGDHARPHEPQPHSHEHSHGAESHTHQHSHDDGQHQHAHGPSHEHSHSSSDEFLQQVRLLKSAEKAAADQIESAKRQAAQIEAEAREKAVETASKAQERAVAAKNEVLARGREETDKEASGILDDAKKQAEKIRGKRLPDRDASSISSGLL